MVVCLLTSESLRRKLRGAAAYPRRVQSGEHARRSKRPTRSSLQETTREAVDTRSDFQDRARLSLPSFLSSLFFLLSSPEANRDERRFDESVPTLR